MKNKLPRRNIAQKNRTPKSSENIKNTHYTH